MTLEEKQVLIKDLCARLPYITYYDLSYYGHKTRAVLQELITTKDPLKSLVKVNTVVNPIPYENIKPYLRPMSSMTEEEKDEYDRLVMCNASWIVDDWLSKNHFDYRGLIPMGFALEAPGGMYKTK